LKRTNIITVAIDSPAAAGAGTQAKLISNHYNLFYLDTGKCYRFIGKLKLKNPQIFSYSLIKKKMNNLKMRDLQSKSLLFDDVATEASAIAKDKKIRKIVSNFQKNCAYNPPKKYFGSCLDGRDITSIIMKDAMFKFYITASVQTRAKRRFKEYKQLNKKITYYDVLKSLKKRDKSDIQRKHGPLKKTSDSVLINTDKLSKTRAFKIIKKIMDKKLKL
jgi:cytidylate kinase|tara:strand:+ start:343 stop:996 length:654 start_codon:yes stop_codon:yes gene_type:complete